MHQVRALLNKNMLVSIRSKEIYIEYLIPMIVALLSSLKQQLPVLNQMMPLLFCLSISYTHRSIMLSMMEEKCNKHKETQKIMGMSDNAYLAGWVLSGYIRVIIAMLVFLGSTQVFNTLFQLEWDLFYRVSPYELMWPYIIFGFTALHQQLFITSLLNDIKFASEISQFYCFAMTFWIYLCYIDWISKSLTYYVLLSIISPQSCIALTYVGCIQSDLKGLNLFLMNLFPLENIQNTYTLTDAEIQLFIMGVVYFLLFLYCEQVIPNDYGIARHPLFFLSRETEYQQFEDETINQLEDTSSATYHEKLQLQFNKRSIVIQQLCKQFNSIKAVDNLTLCLYEQQIFCLLGHNGAGKTTLINVLTGMLPKTSGSVSINGMPLDTQLATIRQSLGLCTQKDCLYDELTVFEHLQFIARIKGKVNDDEIQRIIDKTDLKQEENKLASELSGGSRRKLSLAMALVGDSKIIFLDEPTSGMDAHSRRSIWSILQKIKQENRTIILTTHHLDEAEVLADRIGIMSKGQLIAVGTSDYIKRQFGEGYKLQLTLQHPDTKNHLSKIVQEAIPMCQYTQEQSDTCICEFTIPFTSQKQLTQLFQKLQEQNLIGINMQMNTLEDIFIKIGMEELNRQLLQQSNQENIELRDIQVNALQELPNCLHNPPQYDIIQQIIAMFLRRFYTIIRNHNNYMTILIPMFTLLTGTAIVACIDFTEKLKGINSSLAIEFLQISLICNCAIFSYCLNTSVYLALPVSEKESQIKQVLQGMGCRLFPYWFGTLLIDYLIFMILVGLYFIVAQAVGFELVIGYLPKGLSCFMSFGLSYILFVYMIGLFFKKLETALKVFSILCFLITFFLPFMLIGLLNNKYHELGKPDLIKHILYIVQVVFSAVSPFFAFYLGYFMQNDRFGQLIEYYNCPYLITNTYQYCYMMLAQSVVFSIIICAIENQSYPKFSSYNNVQCDTQGIEQDIIDERERALAHDSKDIIQGLQLEKAYTENIQILQQTTFGVQQGEIFGLLGPNSAGKSTIMNIFTGLTNLTGGQAKINGIEVQDSDTSITQNIGICPQFNCLWENLTSVEHLRLFGRIKGMTGSDLTSTVDYFIQSMQLCQFRNTKASELSGGNRRKLCVADALIGGNDITFFDEPSTGVDPISRKFLYQTLKRNVTIRKCSSIITTHTIDETEGLCQKIGIIVSGQFVCFGSPKYLRQKYGTGYQITIKLKDDQSKSNVSTMILEYFQDCKKLDDQERQFISFTFNQQQFNFYRTFEFFNTQIEKQVIQDFYIHQSSLEQIFLSFCKLQQELNKEAGQCYD